MPRGTQGVASFALRRRLDKAFATAASPSAALVKEMSRLQSLRKITKGRFERARGAPHEVPNDEPRAKRRARSDSSPGNISLDSESNQSGDDSDRDDETTSSIGLESDSDQSDGSWDEEGE